MADTSPKTLHFCSKNMGERAYKRFVSITLCFFNDCYSTERFFAAKDSRKLTFMYLANDVIQNSKKKGPEYGQEFGVQLKKAFEHMSQCDEKTKNSLDRLLTIWQDRLIYNSVQIMEFKTALRKYI